MLSLELLAIYTSAIGLLEKKDEGLGLMGQVLDHTSLAGSGPFKCSAGAPLVAGTLLSALKRHFPAF